MKERAGERRCPVVENASLLNPLLTRPSRGEEEARLEFSKRFVHMFLFPKFGS